MVKIDLDQIVLKDEWSIEEKLRYVEEKIRKSKKEEFCFVFSGEGELLSKTGGNRQFVDLPKVDTKSGYLTHNHPRDSFFTASDLESQFWFNPREIRVVSRQRLIVHPVPNRGKVRLFLTTALANRVFAQLNKARDSRNRKETERLGAMFVELYREYFEQTFHETPF